LSRRAHPRALGDAVRAARAEAEPATLLAAVHSVWDRAVGDRIAREARPLREREGAITVGCRAATWAQELDLLQDELLERLNFELAPMRVESLRFVIDDSHPDDSK
jgi:predicted nucleic acid-binding Zn ribbon protein